MNWLTSGATVISGATSHFKLCLLSKNELLSTILLSIEIGAHKRENEQAHPRNHDLLKERCSERHFRRGTWLIWISM